MIWLYILVVCILFCVAYQDIKMLAVNWPVFPLLGLLLFIINYHQLPEFYFYWSTGINIFIVSLILILLYMYAKYILKQKFYAVFGLGDILFFYAFSLGFPTISFIVLFVFSIIFSLCIHIFLSRKTKNKHVPLAGFMSIFLILILLLDIYLPNFSIYNY